MPPVVRIERGRVLAVRDQSGLAVVEDDQAAGGGLQLLDQLTVTGARWVDVQGCCGVHGVASLCGGRVKQISRIVLIVSIHSVLNYRWLSVKNVMI